MRARFAVVVIVDFFVVQHQARRFPLERRRRGITHVYKGHDVRVCGIAGRRCLATKSNVNMLKTA